MNNDKPKSNFFYSMQRKFLDFQLICTKKLHTVSFHSINTFQILEVGSEWRKLYPPIRLHESWVRDIRFNQNDASFMVTAGDRIAWWNLDLMPSLRAKKPTGEKRQEKTTSGGPVSGRRRLSSTGAGLFT